MTPTPAPTCPKCGTPTLHGACLSSACVPIRGEPKCIECRDTGVVGRPPDDYFNCPKCAKPTAAFRSTQSEPLIPGPSFAELNRERENFVTADDLAEALRERARRDPDAPSAIAFAKPSEPTYNVSAEPYSSKPSEKPEGVREIPITKGLVTIVDEADFQKYGSLKWHAQGRPGHYYATRRENNVALKLHRLIAGAAKDQHVDHINRNSLDNRRSNLRVCSSKENSWNSRRQNTAKKYIGVYYVKEQQKYEAQLKTEKGVIHIGRYESPAQAAMAYDLFALHFRADFAQLNFPDARSVSPLRAALAEVERFKRDVERLKSKANLKREKLTLAREQLENISRLSPPADGTEIGAIARNTLASLGR